MKRIPGLGLVLAVVALKLVFLGLFYPSHPKFFWNPDTDTYVRPALALLSHGTYSQGPARAEEPELNRTPGYPLVIAAVYGLLGQRLWALAVVNILLAAGSACLIGLLARDLFGEREGVLAAVLLTAEPGTVHYSLVALTESLFVFLLVLSAFALARSAIRPGPQIRGMILSGAAFGAAVLVRPIVYYLLPFAPFAAVWVPARAGRGRGAALRRSIAFLVPAALLVGGWQLRNWRVAGSPSISPVQAVNLYFCRAAAVQAEVDGSDLLEVQRSFGWQELLYRLGYVESERAAFGERRYAEVCPETSRLSQVELARRWRREGVAILAHHPGIAAEKLAAGAIWLLLSPPIVNWGFQLGLYRPAEEFVMATLAGKGGTMLRLLARHHPWVLAASALSTLVFLALYAAFGLGVRRGRLASNPALHAALLGTLAYLFIVTAAPEAIDDRYRVPLMPFVCLYAARGIAALIPSARG